MTPHRSSRLALATAVVFVFVGAMHGFGISWAVGLVASGPKDLADVMPALWFGVSLGMAAGGLTLALISRRAGAAAATIAVATALVPAGQVALLAPRMGLAPPIVAFAVAALLALATAWRLAARRDEGTP